MNHRGIDNRPDPETAATPAELIGKLRELRWWAGQPSLRRLRQLGGVNRTADGDGDVDALPESTTSYILRGDRPASAEFVRSFVAACLRVRWHDPDEIAEQVERWHDAWLATAEDAGPATGRPTADKSPAAGPAPPRQLPADVAYFTGRATERATLVAMADTAAPAPAVLVVAGTAGVGKTALAVHVAHRLADRFPDGQLFIDLHGFTPARTPVEPAGGLERLLHTLGVPGDRIPDELDDRAAQWRTLLAGRRMLILLDNAATERQVTPLLPGASGCLVLVTSRRRLAALEATGTVPLDLLPQPEAVALFDRAAGRERPDQSRELVTEAVERCGRLPLAIRIAAARLRSHPAWGVGDLLSRLRDQDRRLAELADEAGSRSVATAIEVSYRQLTAEQQHLYRGLSRHPGPDVDSYATAALLDTSVARAQRLLDQLLDVHLLQEPVPDRYTCHDLVRAHAVAVAAGRRWRRRTAARLRDYYRHTASKAMDAAYPYERDHRPRVPPIRTPTPDFSDPARATTWLDTELPNLLATAHHAAEHGSVELVWQLSATLQRHLRTRGHCHDAELLYQRALTTSRATGHPAGELEALLGLGWASTVRGRYQPALESLTRALEIARTTGNRGGELRAQLGIGLVHRVQGRFRPALDSLTQAREIARTTGDRSATGEALRGVGEVQLFQGEYQPAQDSLTQALAIAHSTGDRSGEWMALLALAAAHRFQGRHEPARTSYTRGLAVARASGSRHGELNALCGLSDVYLAQRQYEPARQALGRALEIARATGYRNSETSTLLALGNVHRLERRYPQAAEHYRQTLRVADETDDRNWQFEARHGLGRLHVATGEPDQAVAHHQAALELATALGQPTDQARAHDGLAHAYHALRQLDQARRHWQHALEILGRLGTDHTGDEEVTAPAIRAHLASLDPDGAPVSGG